MSDYAVLTPFIIPPALAGRKARNIGDGFILERIQRLLRPHRAAFVASTRAPLDGDALERINATRALILAGANQLHDDFAIAPGFRAADLARIRVPVIPFGIGIHGAPGLNDGLSDEGRRMLAAIHERIGHSSWRCDDTIAYLSRQGADAGGKALMTGCPVLLGEDLLGGRAFSREIRSLAVTATERDDFWSRETRTIDFAAERFAGAKRTLVLHQVFPGPAPGKRPWWRRARTQDDLVAYARARGFDIHVPEDVEGCWRFYDGCDAHLGSRLHAHLHFLSRAKASWLTAVDGRSTGMARTFDFPICDPRSFWAVEEAGFEGVRARARAAAEAMQTFVGSIVGGPLA
jgi:hypothetical protein